MRPRKIWWTVLGGGLLVAGVLVLVLERPSHRKRAIDEVRPRSPRLVINEVSPGGWEGRPPFVELRNRSSEPVELDGYVLETGPETSFVLDSELVVRTGGFVVVWLGEGGEASGGERASESDIVGPPSLLEPWLPSLGQLLLRSPSGVPESAVVWGGRIPREERLTGIEEAWPPGRFVLLRDSFGLYPAKTPLPEGASVGLYPGSESPPIANWSVYPPSETTPRAENPIPRPHTFSTPDGARIGARRVSLAWMSRPSDLGYRYQLASSPEFSPASIVEDGVAARPFYQSAEDLPEGEYYFRVSAQSRLSSRELSYSRFGEVLNFSLLSVACPNAAILPMDHLVQRKDSNLLCLDGCALDVSGATALPWNAPHPITPPASGDHGFYYCANASIAMVVSNYGKSLSQDVVSNFTSESWCEAPAAASPYCGQPEGDLAHYEPFDCPWDDFDCPRLKKGLDWALQASVEVHVCDPSPGSCGPLSFGDIEVWIASGRPAVARLRDPGYDHIVVLGGTCTESGEDYVWVHDSMLQGGEFRAFEIGDYKAFWVGPSSAPNARSNDPNWFLDGDGDGIANLDEVERFETDPQAPDSDGDGLEDRTDLQSYVFAPWKPDFDGDGLRKEVDPDNDGDGCLDGVEDSNQSGFQDPGETSNFEASDCEMIPTGCRCR